MNEQSIFEAVLAIDEPTERSAFLDRACAGAAALRAQVEKLLQEHERSSGATDRPVRSLSTPGQLADTIDETPAAHETLTFLAPSDKPSVLGRLDRYEILEVIGKGGMGMVLRAFDERLQRTVAIKVMAAHLAINATARKRFGREARTAAAVCHDHIVTIHAVEEARALPYLVMKYVPGVSLQQRLRDEPLPLEDIVRIGMETASGLAAAHAKGLIHRDIKPANILLETVASGQLPVVNKEMAAASLATSHWPLTTAFRVKITDFGLARAADDSSLTQTGVVAGTPDYMSPEQARGERVDARTDLFSLGSVLYFMCTRRAPFHADETLAILSRVCEDTPTPIRQINAEIPDWLAAIIEKLHAKEPAQRFQSAAEVAELLGLHLAHLRNPAPVVQVANTDVSTLTRRASEGSSLARRVSVSEDAEGQNRAPRHRRAILASLVLLLAALSLTEATGVTTLTATVIDVFAPDETFTPDGTQVAIEKPLVAIDKPLVAIEKPTTAAISEIWRNSKPGFVHDIAFSPDGKHGVACAGKLVFRFDPISGQMLEKMAGHEDDVRSVAFSPDGRWIASGGQDATVRIWDAATGREKRRFDTERTEDGGRPFSYLAFSPDGKRLLAGSRNDLLLWEWEADVKPRRFVGHTHAPRRVAFSPDGTLVASCDHGGTARLWRSDTGELLRTLREGSNWIMYVGFSPDGKLLATGGRQVTLWDVETGKERWRFAIGTDWAEAMAFTPDGRFVLAAIGNFLPKNEGELVILETRTGRPVHRTRGLTGYIFGLATSSDGRDVFIGENGGMRLWRLPKNLWPAASVQTEPGWVQLFNGKDLTGWKTHPQKPDGWKVENGELIGTSLPRSYLFTERGDYRNFHLRTMVKMNAEGDSGLTFRCEYGFQAKPNTPAGYEANIGNFPCHGGLFDPMIRLVPSAPRDLFRPDTWFSMEVIAQEGHIVVKIDGQTVVDYQDAEPARSFGHIALQAWCPTNETHTQVHFRKIEIKELLTGPELAVERAEKAVEKHPNSGQLLKNLGTAYYRAERWQLAADTLARADKVSHDINQSFSPFMRAMAYWKLGDQDLARKWYAAALVWMARIGPKNPELLSLRAEAAKLLDLREELSAQQEQAVSDYYGKYVTLVIEADPEATWAYHDRGRGYVKNKQWDEAAADFRQAVDILENRVKERPLDVPNRWRLALAHQDLAEVLLYHLSRPEDAAKSRQRQVALFKQLVAESPNASNREQLGHSYRWLAFDFERLKQPLQAEQAFEKAIDYLDKFVGDFPKSPGYRGILADTCDRWRRLLAASGKPEEAAKAFDKTILVLKSFPPEHATTREIRESLSELHHRRGNLLREAQRPADAEAAYREAIDVLAKLATDHSGHLWYRHELGRNHNWLGIVLAQNGKPEEAELAHHEALGIYEKLTKETDTSASHWHRRELAWTCLNLGETVEKARRFDEAMKLYRRAAELCEKLATENPDGTYPYWASQCYGKLISLLTATGQPEEATVICRKLVQLEPPLSGQRLNEIAWSLVTGADPKSWAPKPAVELAQKAVELAKNSADCWNTLGVAHYRDGDWQAAIRALTKSDALEGPKYFELNAFHLAMAHWQAGEKDQARKWYAAALVWMEKQNSKVDVVLRARSEAASLLGLDVKQEQAKTDDVKLYTLVVEANPESAWAYQYRGRAFGRAKQWDKALPDFSKAIEVKQDYWPVLADRGWARRGLKQFDESIKDYSKALEHPAALDWVWGQRGQTYCDLGQWDNAAADFVKAIELNKDNPQHPYWLALVRLQQDDRDGYRKVCAGMLERFGSKAHTDAGYWAAWTCVLRPDAVSDWKSVLSLAEKSLAADPKNYDKLNHVGTVLYRAGQFKEAVKRLAEAEAAFQEAKNPRGTLVYCWLFQAMSLHRDGQVGEAKKYFDKAAQAIDHPPEKSNDVGATTWNRRFTLQLLRGEAQTQLDKKN